MENGRLAIECTKSYRDFTRAIFPRLSDEGDIVELALGSVVVSNRPSSPLLEEESQVSYTKSIVIEGETCGGLVVLLGKGYVHAYASLTTEPRGVKQISQPTQILEIMRRITADIKKAAK